MKAVQKYSLDSEYKQTESFSQYNKQYAFLSKQYTKNLNKPSKATYIFTLRSNTGVAVTEQSYYLKRIEKRSHIRVRCPCNHHLQGRHSAILLTLHISKSLKQMTKPQVIYLYNQKPIKRQVRIFLSCIRDKDGNFKLILVTSCRPIFKNHRSNDTQLNI